MAGIAWVAVALVILQFDHASVTTVYPLWWLGLISGIVMTGLAFWTEGQVFIGKAYVLLVFAGIWALMQGITSIVRAFEIRALREEP